MAKKRNKKVIFVVDDEPGVLKALSLTLKQLKDTTVVAFESAGQCLLRLAVGDCDMIITDVNMPDMDGIEMLKEVRKQRPALPVLLITGYGDIPMAVKALKLGAADFIEKPLDEEFFLSVVKDTLEDSYDHEGLIGRGLTNSEIKILKFISEGRTNKDIAFSLRRSTRTIENHRHKIMRKLNAESTAELVKFAIKMGLDKLD